MGQQPKKYHMTEDGNVYRVNEDGSFTSIGNVEDLERKPSGSPTDTYKTVRDGRIDEVEKVPKPELNNISTSQNNTSYSKVKRVIIALIPWFFFIIPAIYYIVCSNHNDGSVDVTTNMAESQIEDYNLGTLACRWDGDINNHYITFAGSEESHILSAYLNYNYSNDSEIPFIGDRFTMSFDINIADNSTPQNLFEICDGSWNAVPLFSVYYDTNALFVRTFTRYDYQETVDIAENDNNNGKYFSVEVVPDLKENEWMRVTILYDKGNLFVNNHEFNISRFPKIFDKKENKYRYGISCELPYQNRSIRIKDFVMTVE